MCLCNLSNVITEDIFQEMIDQVGLGLIKETIGAANLSTMTVDDVMPRHRQVDETMTIPFEKFLVMSPDFDVIGNESIFNRLILSPYVLVKPSQRTSMEQVYNNHRIIAWIDNEGSLCELIGKTIAVVEKDTHRQTTHVSTVIPKCVYALYGPLDRPNPKEETELTTVFDIKVEGVYTASRHVSTQSVLFRSPVMCKQMQLEDMMKFPLLVQRKLDGNRIIIYVCKSSGTITYYSKVGAVQTAKFGRRFDSDVRQLVDSFETDYDNIMLDCECYRHDSLHQLIGGWCNRIGKRASDRNAEHGHSRTNCHRAIRQ